MRRPHRRQRLDLHIPRPQVADQVARVQPAHTVRHNINRFAAGFGLDLAQELDGALLDRRRRAHRGRDDLDAVGVQRLFDAPPVVDAGEELADWAQLVEAEEAVREYDGVFGGLVCVAEGGEVVFD